jgi:hypothetical protein
VRRADREVTGQTERAIRERQTDPHQVTQRSLRIQVRALRPDEWERRSGLRGQLQRQIRLGAVTTTLPADPLAVVALIIVTVEGEAVTVGT